MAPELTYLYAVYTEGSFSKAAEKLFITQPALSIAIKKIEDEIGMPLFDRKKKPLKLTDAGEIYIDAIKKMQITEMESRQKINDIKNLNTGLIRLGGTNYLNSYILPAILMKFTKRYPNISLQIYERSSFELISMLSSQEIDLTFSCDPQAIKDFPCYEIFDDHILFAVPDSAPFNREHEDKALTAADIINRKHLEPDCRKITIEEVSEEEIILLRKGNNLQERVLEMYKKTGLKAKVKFDLNQLVTAYHMAEAGLGATFTSDRVVTNENSSLKFYALADPLAKRTFNLLLPKNTYTPIAVQRFIELSKRK